MEENDELPANTAFLDQTAPNTGTTSEHGVIVSHPGFKPQGEDGILDTDGFQNVSFLDDGYTFMSLTVEELEEIPAPQPLSDMPSMVDPPTKSPTAAPSSAHYACKSKMVIVTAELAILASMIQRA